MPSARDCIASFRARAGAAPLKQKKDASQCIRQKMHSAPARARPR